MQLAPILPQVDIEREFCNALASEIAKELDKQIFHECAHELSDITYDEYAMKETVATGKCMSKRSFQKMKKRLAKIENGFSAC